MATVQHKGNKTTIETNVGELKYNIKRIKGLITYSIYKEDGQVLKGGLLSRDDARKWLESYAKKMV